VRWIHRFLAENYRKLGAGEDLMSGPETPGLEMYRQERAKLARLDRLEREGSLLRLEDVHESLMELADLLRGAGDQLQREYGPDAMQIIDETLTEFNRRVLKRFPYEPDREADAGDDEGGEASEAKVQA
jgi:hypothetical protein